MSKNLPFMQWQLGLPIIDSIDNSEQAFGDAFLSAAQILYKHLLQIKSATEVIKEFSQEPLNLAVLQLFSKMCRSYYSYVLLEVNQDRAGSQIFIEHLCEATITLTYLLEEADRSIFVKYVQASIHQAGYLLVKVKEQLLKVPNHPDLLVLQDKLETFINKQEQTENFELIPDLGTYLWGSQKAETTTKRGAIVGLNFLNNPARQITTKVIPASYLDLQLNYFQGAEQSSQINFTYLRDAAHLCLHATQVFLEEVVDRQKADVDVEDRQQILNALYEWFYNAHIYYQLHGCKTIQKEDSCKRK